MSVLSTCLQAYLKGQKIVFFGAGQYSLSLMPLISNTISYFVDNSPAKQGTKFWGIDVFKPEILNEEDTENIIILINSEYYQEMAKQCYEMGHKNIYSGMYMNANTPVPKSDIYIENFLMRRASHFIEKYGDEIIHTILGKFEDDNSREMFTKIIELYKKGNFDFSSVCSEGMYFNDIFSIENNEVFIDCGVYDGKTIVDFILFSKGKYKKIYGFEPDSLNYSLSHRHISDLRGVTLLNKGVSDSEGELLFDNRGTQSSKLVENQDGNEFVKIQVTKLDSLLEEKVSFIKMDIEGAEFSAIHGATELIKKYKPKLAISVYHNDDDLIRIPILLHQLVPEYKLYLRHHTTMHVDTVLYAKI